MREDPTCAQEVLAIATTTMMSIQEHAFVIVFGSPLFCTGEGCTDLPIDVIVIFERIALQMGKFMRFFLMVPDIRHPQMGKNRMRRHTIFHSYCRYYVRYYYRVTTVVTTIATRHGIMTSLYHVGQLLSLLQSSWDRSNDGRNGSSYGKSYDDACDFFSHLRMPDVGHRFFKKIGYILPIGPYILIHFHINNFSRVYSHIHILIHLQSYSHS